ncbi:MAG: hypothetical protein MJZ95_05600, partial [Paludibacteraceae bacterium]|nr:hypothetical protein [Paludibacteraceae bacterium]
TTEIEKISILKINKLQESVKNWSESTCSIQKKIRTFAVRTSAALGIIQINLASALVCTSFAAQLRKLNKQHPR